MHKFLKVSKNMGRHVQRFYYSSSINSSTESFQEILNNEKSRKAIFRSMVKYFQDNFHIDNPHYSKWVEIEKICNKKIISRGDYSLLLTYLWRRLQMGNLNKYERELLRQHAYLLQEHLRILYDPKHVNLESNCTTNKFIIPNNLKKLDDFYHFTPSKVSGVDRCTFIKKLEEAFSYITQVSPKTEVKNFLKSHLPKAYRFEVEIINIKDCDFLFLHSTKGHGNLLINTSILAWDKVNVIQCPHPIADTHSLEIGLLTLQNPSNVSIFQSSSTDRKAYDDTHLEESAFCDMTRALLPFCKKTGSHFSLKQIHGFYELNMRKNALFLKSHVIISCGLTNSSKLAREAVNIFQKWFPEIFDKIKFYDKVKRDAMKTLGATQNKVLKLINGSKFNDGTIHIELSTYFREAIRKNKKLRDRLTACLDEIARLKIDIKDSLKDGGYF